MRNDFELKKFNEELNNSFNDQTFGFRDNYIISKIEKSISFTVFIRKEKIGLKYPFKNINQDKIDALTTLISEIHSDFKHKKYKTSPYNNYSIWELNTEELKNNEIIDLIKKIKMHFL
ncbi:hypothetical protein B0I03_107154 [Flavobacterium aquaticum]|uniref:Uncharacterized protein n=2 Tax=Flavobacterium aquaticum TaxID=1236486 RepID=A0A327YIE0_9FLAO|nr:hypothetical protein B0I03_107154 [Flavobacterium aquaticum]